MFIWWFNSRVQHICFAVSPLQFCRWGCHTILYDVGPKTTWSASGEIREGPRQFHSVEGEFSVTFPLIFQNHYPFKVPSLGWLREIVALLFWQSEITVKCHKWALHLLLKILVMPSCLLCSCNGEFCKVSVINNLFTKSERKINRLSVLTFEAFPQCACECKGITALIRCLP